MGVTICKGHGRRPTSTKTKPGSPPAPLAEGRTRRRRPDGPCPRGHRTDLIAVLDHPDVRTATPGFVKMMTFTQHPTFQLGPCPCGSGQPNYQCHQPELLHGKPCTCRSGRMFEDCCRVDATCDEPPILDGVIVQTDNGAVMEARNVPLTA